MSVHPNEITSRRDLAAFVAELRTDFGRRPETWENADLGSFLKALARYFDDLDGWCKNNAPDIDPELASWRLFAVALAGAQVYE